MPAPWLIWATEYCGKLYYYYSTDRLAAAEEILAPCRIPPRKWTMTRAVRDTVVVTTAACAIVIAARALSR